MKNPPRGSSHDHLAARPDHSLSTEHDMETTLLSPTEPEPVPVASQDDQPSTDAPPRKPRKRAFSRIDEEKSVAAELEQMFDEDFKGAGLEGKNAFQGTLASFHRKFNNNPLTTRESLLGFHPTEPSNRTISYDKLFYIMSEELVEMLSFQFGSLADPHLGQENARFFAFSLLNDNTSDMFKPTTKVEQDPLATIENTWILQMIEVWFSVHPLSNVISKTLFLREYRNSSHDVALLAVIIADASYVHEDKADQAAKQKNESFYQWTVLQLWTRPARTCNLSTVQTLILLGWHELCLARARRATCYLGYAGRVVATMQNDSIQPPDTGFSQINGVDVGKIDTELIQNMYWLTFAITLWSFMQLDQPFMQLLPANIPIDFPPIDESFSTVIQLDIASHNVSTVQKQSRIIRELWPLSYIASTTAHIYALLPREHGTNEAPRSLSWQSRPLYQLRGLLSLNHDLSVLCINIRQILTDAINALESNVKNVLSKALVLTPYHTMIIHMLFPRLDSTDARVIVTEKLLDEFGTSARSLVDTFSAVEREDDNNRLITSIQSSTFADIFVLGLDACGRAIDYFQSRSQEGTESEVEIISKGKKDLISYAIAMHKIAKSERLLTAKNIRAVKKRLKKAKFWFDRISSSSTEGSSPVDENIAPSTNLESPALIPTPALAGFQSSIHAAPDMQLDKAIQELFGHDFQAPTTRFWPERSSLDFLGGQDDVRYQEAAAEIDTSQSAGPGKNRKGAGGPSHMIHDSENFGALAAPVPSVTTSMLDDGMVEHNALPVQDDMSSDLNFLNSSHIGGNNDALASSQGFLINWGLENPDDSFPPAGNK